MAAARHEGRRPDVCGGERWLTGYAGSYGSVPSQAVGFGDKGWLGRSMSWRAAVDNSVQRRAAALSDVWRRAKVFGGDR